VRTQVSTRKLAFAAIAVIVLLAGCSQNQTPVASTPPAPAARPDEIRVSGAPNTIPSGTKLQVRTNEQITSSSGEGRTYSAQLETDVVDQDGKVLLPKGSPVELVLMEAKQGGGIRGSSVQLGMRSVTAQGSTYLVISQEVERTSGIGKNTRTAQMVGGGAALGTLIGAAAGGGKGAALGGLAGAAAGALAQILTQGKDVRIPAETVLTFQLDEPIQLQPAPTSPSPASSTP
jgi:hypothetical protein